jgi:hypothetical protein
VATHGESFSSCYNEAYNEAIEDMELQLLQLLQWSTFCTATDFEHRRQCVIDRSVEVMAEPDDGPPGSTVLCQADWEYMHERAHACMHDADRHRADPQQPRAWVQKHARCGRAFP